MRIVHVINSLDTGGAESFVAQLVPALAARGLDTELAVLEHAAGPAATLLRAHGFETGAPLGRGRRFDPRATRALRRRTRGADVVHAHLFPTQYWTVLAWLPDSDTARPRLVTTEHNTANRRRRHVATRALDRWIYRRYDAVVSVSPAVAAGLDPLLVPGATRHLSIPTAIERARFEAPDDAAIRTRPVDGPANGERSRIVMVASFSVQKDQDTLVHALRTLPRSVELVLAGTGPRLDAVRGLASTLGVGDRVHFPGRVDDVPTLLAGARIAVLSSHHEGMPLVALEAFAAGVPFVGSAVAGLGDLAARGGIAVAPRDVAALGAALAGLLESTRAREDCIRRGREVADAHAIERIAESHHALYAALSDGSFRNVGSASELA